MRRNGFALIELIVTLILVALLAAMVAPYFMSGVTQGANALNAMPTPLSLQTVMTKMIDAYDNNGTNNYLYNLSALSTAIGTGNTYVPAGYTLVTNNPNYKFQATDLETALLVTIKNNATSQSMTYIFTRQ
jgi:prepilin-type N-terminal cleavage/methylation domain-containing protein